MKILKELYPSIVYYYVDSPLAIVFDINIKLEYKKKKNKFK